MNEKWSKVGRRSRSKGKRFEREVAKMLTTHTGCVWQTTRNSGRTDLKGDVYSDVCLNEVIVECKHRANLDMRHMLDNSKTWRMFMAELDSTNGEHGDLQVAVVKTSYGVWASIWVRDGRTWRPVSVTSCPRIVTLQGVCWSRLEFVAAQIRTHIEVTDRQMVPRRKGGR